WRRKPPGPTETILGRLELGFGRGCDDGGAAGARSPALVWRGGAGGAAGSGVLAAAGRGAGFRGAGAGAAAFFSAFFGSFAFTGDGRDFRPRRCALPITALRLTPPSSSAIWLAVAPPSHIFFSVAIRSSVQLIRFPFAIKSIGARLASEGAEH